jgi:hypothetical protein
MSDALSVAVVGVIGTLGVAAIGVVGAMLIKRQDTQIKQIGEVGHSVDGRMDEMLTITRELGEALGAKREQDAQAERREGTSKSL